MAILGLLSACEPDPEPAAIGPDIYIDIKCAKSIPDQGYRYQAYFQGNYYLLSDSLKNLHQARICAASLGGHLVSIQSLAENQQVQQLLDSAKVSYALIGLADLNTEGQHQWLNNESFQYKNWQVGEPNNQAFASCINFYQANCDEDAVTIASASHIQAGGWNDVPDTFTYRFVVEIECEGSDSHLQTKK